jgi:arylsulfatase A-like enzyme
VLFVLVDTLRADHLGAYGYDRPTSPELDRLAAESLVFEQAIAPSSWTLPSVASLFTGLYPYSHGVLGVAERSFLDPPFATLAESLRERGFTTAAFVANPILLPKFGFDQGFETYSMSTYVDAEPLVEDFVAWLDEVRDFRWFGYLHLLDPHSPYWPPERERQDFAGEPPTSRDFSRDLPASVLSGEARPSDEELRHAIDLYDAEILSFDRALGTLRRALESRGLLDSTLLVFTSDHGEEFFEHGFFGHGFDVYDETIRVPLLLRLPGRIEPGRVARQVETISIYRTVLSILDLDPPDGIEGANLLQPVGDPWAFSMIRGSHMTREKDFASIRSYHSLRGEGRKLVVSPKGDVVELYDLALDPGETRNLAAERPDDVARLRAILDARVGETLRATEPLLGPIDPDMKAVLEQLGYLGGAKLPDSPADG